MKKAFCLLTALVAFNAVSVFACENTDKERDVTVTVETQDVTVTTTTEVVTQSDNPADSAE